MDETRASILIVDDEESIRTVVSRRLEADGYNCVTAKDGNEALWQSFMHDFDLVLTDIKMPGMSGMEVLSQIMKDHPDTGVIMITALAETQTAVEAMKLGAYDYVTKPFNLDDLVMRVERALERRRLVLENREYQIHLEQKVERQLGQIKQYYQEAIAALAREEMALEELNTLRQTGSQERDTDEKAAHAFSYESAGSIKGFAKKLSMLIGSTGPDSEDGITTDIPEQEEQATEESSDELPVQQEEAVEHYDSDTYIGTIELVIAPPVGLFQMMHLHEHLRDIPQIRVLNLGGSVDNGITIRITLENPTPLAKIISDLPEVQRVSDDEHESEKIIPKRKDEHPPVRRIVVELLKTSTSEAAQAMDQEQDPIDL